MIIEIEDQILNAAHLDEKGVKLELAIQLYHTGKISGGLASKMAGIHRMEFQEELGRRLMPVNYDVDEFEKDLNMIKKLNAI